MFPPGWTGYFILAESASFSHHMRHRVLLVDDHQLVREGIKHVLEHDSGLFVCGEAENGKEAVAKTITLKPDVVLMDLSMPVMGGIEATGLIRRSSPATKIIILSLHDSNLVEEQAKKAGAHAFVCKSRSAGDLIDVINAILEAGASRKETASSAKSLEDVRAWKGK